MFHRIVYQDWQLIIPVVSLGVAGCIYLAAAIGAARAKSGDSARVARLPLED